MDKVRVIRIEQTGGPEVMDLQTSVLAPPGPGMVTVANQAVGLNYIDTYHRSGLYPLPLPSGLGLEAAGVVVAVGDGVRFSVGDRVAYCSAVIGAYAEAVNLPASRLVSLPERIDFETAAACLLKGQTTEFLLRRTWPLQAGETCLFHAAAGGVGLLFGQWAASLGIRVIGTVGSDEKAAVAKKHGFAEVINYRTENVLERVLQITGGEKLPVVFDGVGRDTFDVSLECLRPRGLMVSFGNASGAPAPLELQTLAQKGSLFVTRPTMINYTATTEALQASSLALFDRLIAGDICVEIHQRYALADVQRAHRDLEARRTIGSSVILPR